MKRSEMISKLIDFHEETFPSVGRGMSQQEYFSELLDLIKSEEESLTVVGDVYDRVSGSLGRLEDHMMREAGYKFAKEHAIKELVRLYADSDDNIIEYDKKQENTPEGLQYLGVRLYLKLTKPVKY